MKTAAASLLFLLFCLGPALSDTEPGPGDEENWQFDYDVQKNIDKFKNADVVVEFMKHYEKGLLARDKPFNMRDPDIRAETISLVDLFFYAKDQDTLENLIKWLFKKVNQEQFLYATEVAFVRRGDLGWKESDLHLWSEANPVNFVPYLILKEVNASVYQGTYNNSNVQLLVPDESDPTAYFREDPDLSRMYYNWNIFFPNWMDPEKYGDPNWPTRGDLFYEFHNQLAVAYYLRTNAKRPDWLTQWKDSIKEGYKTELVNIAKSPFSSRTPNHPPVKNEYYHKLMEIQEKIKTIFIKEEIYVNETYSVPFKGTNDSVIATMLSNIVYQTTDSVNASYYGSLFEAGISYLASLGSDPSKDIGGLSSYPVTAPRDPAFYELLEYVNRPVKDYKSLYSSHYTKEELIDDDLTLHSMETSRLETFFELVDVDLSRMISRRTPLNSYIVRRLRLNHLPFATRFNVTNKSDVQKSALISVYLAKDIFGDAKDSDDVQPIDSFKAVVKPGQNVIERNHSDSCIFTGSLEFDFMVPCGIPKTLMLPKGSEEGQRWTLIAIITPYIGVEEEPEYMDLFRSPLCGNLIENHGRNFGFPLDRNFPRDMKKQQAVYLNATIYHKRNTFEGGIII